MKPSAAEDPQEKTAMPGERERWDRLKQVFEGALERDPASRGAYLDAACGEDRELREEAESLIAAHDQADSFFDDASLSPTATGSGSPAGSEGRLAPGTRLGPYEIVAFLNAGGMGEVYRARDTRLGREVAVKLLLGRLSTDGERIRRFEQEARSASALNHPNILTVHDFGTHGSAQYIVTELIRGVTLRERLAQGPLPAAELLSVAVQLATGLAKAHEADIVHRDLKPENVMLTEDGLVKILDFGLATLKQAPVSEVHAEARTRTRSGVILGTIGYMSPEQARTGPTDFRSDQFLFGAVLYEMATGRKAFGRQTPVDSLFAILHEQPEPAARLNPGLPEGLQPIMERCLAKDPSQRYASTRELLQALQGLEAALAEDRVLGKASLLRRRGLTLAIAVPALALAAAWLLRPRGDARPVTSPSEYVQLTNFTDSAVAPSLSRDGKRVAFIRAGDAFLGRGQVYAKTLPTGASVRLTSDASYKHGPVFSPDGSRIAYTRFSSRSWDTWTVPALGGEPSRFLPNASGLVWIGDRRFLFAEFKNEIQRGIVTATEGRAERREVYSPAPERALPHFAYPSPDLQSVLVVEMDGSSHHFSLPCRLLPFDGSSIGRQVGPRGACTSAAWSPDGKWMYFGASVGGSSHLWRQRFPDGTPEQITFGPTEEEGVTVAPDGRSLVTALGTRRSAIWIHDHTGERAISSEGYAQLPRLSRDGTRVSYLMRQDSSSPAELRFVDLRTGKTESVLPGVSVVDYDISRDETEVAYTTTDAGGESRIWLAPLDRRTSPRQIARTGDQVSFGVGGDLVFRSLDDNTTSLVRIKKDGSGRERLTTLPILEKLGVSPNGEWVAVQSPATDEAGEHIHVTFAVPINGGAPRKTCFSACPVQWSADGRFFYMSIGFGAGETSPGATAVIPVPAGKSLPDLPASGIDTAARSLVLPGAQFLKHDLVSPGPDPSTYVFTKSERQRNLFRIPLH